MKARSLVAVVAAALVVATGFVSCSKKKVEEKNTFVLGLDDSFPPLGFRDENNNIVGYDIDLAKEVAKRMNKELVCQPIDWAAKEQELNTKKIDCIWNGFTMTKERQAAMAFTKPYLDNAQVVVVRADSGIKTLSGLTGKVIGVQSGSSAEDALNENESFKKSLKSIVEFKENITALNDLEIKNVDGVVMDQVVANYSIKQTGRDYIVLAEGLANEEYGIAFRKDDVELRDRVQLILEEMERDGTIATISSKWFGKNMSVIGR